jgi:transketolase
VKECLTLRQFGSRLQGHPERLRMGGLETTSGPLGEGLSQGAGMAKAFLMDKKVPTSRANRRVYVVMGDGEQDEGIVWEAAMWTAKNKLHNLTAIIDRNNIQIDGMTEDIMPMEALRARYESFGWHVIEVDGHNIRQFVEAVDEARAIFEQPTLILAHTIPGKGIPEIEFDYHWHGKSPTPEEGKQFLKELRTLNGRLPHEYA